MSSFPNSMQRLLWSVGNIWIRVQRFRMSILKSFQWISKLEINLKPILNHLKPILKILNDFEISIPRAGSAS